MEKAGGVAKQDRGLLERDQVCKGFLLCLFPLPPPGSGPLLWVNMEGQLSHSPSFPAFSSSSTRSLHCGTRRLKRIKSSDGDNDLHTDIYPRSIRVRGGGVSPSCFSYSLLRVNYVPRD